MRDVKFNLVLSKDERAALERLARDTGVSNADVIRQLILAAAKRQAATRAKHDRPISTL